MKIPLNLLNQWIDEQVGVSALDIFRKVVQGNFPKQEVTSLGKDWKKMEGLFQDLGRDEFEVYLQTQIDGQPERIAKRGFYPALMCTPEAVSFYENERASVISLWRSPSLRHKDPVFSKLFPIECELVSEYWSRYLKNPATTFQECLWFVGRNCRSDVWVSTRFNYTDITDEDSRLRLLFQQGRTVISSKQWSAKRVEREVLRSKIEACLIESRKMLKESEADLLVDVTRIDEELCEILAPELLERVGSCNRKFSLNVHHQSNWEEIKKPTHE